MEPIKIVSNVPIPSKIGAGKPSMYPFAQMKAKDSFYVESKTLIQVRNAARMFGLKHGKKFYALKEGSGVRCWCINDTISPKM